MPRQPGPRSLADSEHLSSAVKAGAFSDDPLAAQPPPPTRASRIVATARSVSQALLARYRGPTPSSAAAAPGAAASPAVALPPIVFSPGVATAAALGAANAESASRFQDHIDLAAATSLRRAAAPAPPAAAAPPSMPPALPAGGAAPVGPSGERYFADPELLRTIMEQQRLLQLRIRQLEILQQNPHLSLDELGLAAAVPPARTGAGAGPGPGGGPGGGGGGGGDGASKLVNHHAGTTVALPGSGAVLNTTAGADDGTLTTAASSGLSVISLMTHAALSADARAHDLASSFRAALGGVIAHLTGNALPPDEFLHAAHAAAAVVAAGRAATAAGAGVGAAEDTALDVAIALRDADFALCGVRPRAVRARAAALQRRLQEAERTERERLRRGIAAAAAAATTAATATADTSKALRPATAALNAGAGAGVEGAGSPYNDSDGAGAGSFAAELIEEELEICTLDHSDPEQNALPGGAGAEVDGAWSGHAHSSHGHAHGHGHGHGHAPHDVHLLQGSLVPHGHGSGAPHVHLHLHVAAAADAGARRGARAWAAAVQQAACGGGAVCGGRCEGVCAARAGEEDGEIDVDSIVPLADVGTGTYTGTGTHTDAAGAGAYAARAAAPRDDPDAAEELDDGTLTPRRRAQLEELALELMALEVRGQPDKVAGAAAPAAMRTDKARAKRGSRRSDDDDDDDDDDGEGEGGFGLHFDLGSLFDGWGSGAVGGPESGDGSSARAGASASMGAAAVRAPWPTSAAAAPAPAELLRYQVLPPAPVTAVAATAAAAPPPPVSASVAHPARGVSLVWSVLGSPFAAGLPAAAAAPASHLQPLYGYATASDSTSVSAPLATPAARPAPERPQALTPLTAPFSVAPVAGPPADPLTSEQASPAVPHPHSALALVQWLREEPAALVLSAADSARVALRLATTSLADRADAVLAAPAVSADIAPVATVAVAPGVVTGRGGERGGDYVEFMDDAGNRVRLEGANAAAARGLDREMRENNISAAFEAVADRLHVLAASLMR